MIEEFVRVKYADSYLSESAIFKGGTKGKPIPIIFSFYFLKINSKVVLVDAGCDTMPGFVMENYMKPDEALKKHNIHPDQVSEIIITHADHDHIDGVRHFKNAKIYIQKNEYERGKTYIPKTNEVILFDEEITLFDEIRVLKIGGHQIGSSVVEFDFRGNKYVIAGDECYSDYNIINKVPTAASYNYENSKMFIERYSNSNYKVLLMH